MPTRPEVLSLDPVDGSARCSTTRSPWPRRPGEPAAGSRAASRSRAPDRGRARRHRGARSRAGRGARVARPALLRRPLGAGDDRGGGRRRRPRDAARASARASSAGTRSPPPSPDVVVVMPCGLYAAEAEAEAQPPSRAAGRPGRRAGRRGRRGLLLLPSRARASPTASSCSGTCSIPSWCRRRARSSGGALAVATSADARRAATTTAATKQATPSAGQQPELGREGLATGDPALGRDDEQRAERAADHPAEVPADRDVRDGEGDDEVEHEPEAELADDLVHAALAGDHDRRQEEPVDRARGADRELAGSVSSSAPTRAGDQRDEVDGDEASGADRRLEHLAEDVEHEHVEREVDDRPVQEAGGEHAPPLAAVGLQDQAVPAQTPPSPIALPQRAPSTKTLPPWMLKPPEPVTISSRKATTLIADQDDRRAGRRGGAGGERRRPHLGRVASRTPGSASRPRSGVMQSGQIGRPQREQATPVSRSGWR